MPKHRFRGALNSATFPLASVLHGRTVVQPQLDNNVKTNQAFYGTQESADYSIPQLLYCENVMPTAEGLQSVSYVDMIQALPGASDFDQVMTLRDENENNFLFCPAQGRNYIYTANVGQWVSTNPIDATGKKVTRAYVNGRTFVCYEGLGIYEYDPVALTFDKQTITGLTDDAVKGIFSSNNYLGAYEDITVYWSSLIDPLDFVPSTSTGAGFSVPQDVKAAITAVLGTAGGFIIYTAKNAVAAVYTQNIRAPFTFKEISNAGGILTYEQVTSDQSAGPQHAWTTGGLQKITPQGSEPVSSEVSDFLAGKLWESWNSTTKQLELHYEEAAEFGIKITYVSSRYLIISYSVDNSGLYQYALVLDTVLKRWGKLKIDHVDCFSYPYPNVFGNLRYQDLSNTTYEQIGASSYSDLAVGISSDPPSKRAISFLSANGAVKLLEMDYNKDTQNGVVVLGKFQLMRARMMTLQILDLEGVYRDETTLASKITVTALASLDGFNMNQPVTMMLLSSNNLIQRYARRLTGINVSIAVEGTFAMSSYILEVTADGDR